MHALLLHRLGEIDIDDETYKRYMTLDGLLLASACGTLSLSVPRPDTLLLMNMADVLCLMKMDFAHYVLNMVKRVCAGSMSYVRFAFRYGCTREMSLSMSCEEAARLIITDPDPVKLISSGTDTKSLEFDEDDDEFCSDDTHRVCKARCTSHTSE